MSKFGNIPTNYDGKSFHSKLEAGRYAELALLQKAGEISDLQTQVTFRLIVNGQLICKYIADFTYDDKNGYLVVEDAKGIETPEFKLKKKLMLACNGHDVRCIYAVKRRFPQGRRFGR